MAKPQNIISGEAPDSDEETSDDFSTSPSAYNSTSPTRSEVLNRLSSFDYDDSQSYDAVSSSHHQAMNQSYEPADTQVLDIETPIVLTDNVAPSADVDVKTTKSYNSLLHKKLRECNASLHASVTQSLGGMYDESAKSIHNITTQLNKSQAAIQDISNKMRLTTNDLFQIEDTLDVINSTCLLPTFKRDDYNPTPS